MLLALVETNVIEDKELGFGTEKSGIGNAGRSEIQLGLLGDVARIAVVTLLGDWIDDVADHHQSGNFGERIQHVSVGIGNQQHVAFIDRRPAANG